MSEASMNPIEGATITVRGEASLRADPDEALLWITLSEVENTSGKALADVGRRTEALLALLDELLVAGEDRSSSGVSVAEEFESSSARGRRSLGHRATAGVALRVSDADVISRVISRSVEELRASISGPRWFVSPAHPIRLEAARHAAAEAQRKAEAYASGVGAELGALIALVEPERPGGSTLRLGHFEPLSGTAAETGRIPIDAGQIEVTAAIDATFELRPRQR
jgi:uncharacterized protein YggE